jgi:hypothetical protein
MRSESAIAGAPCCRSQGWMVPLSGSSARKSFSNHLWGKYRAESSTADVSRAHNGVHVCHPHSMVTLGQEREHEGISRGTER